MNTDCFLELQEELGKVIMSCQNDFTIVI